MKKHNALKVVLASLIILLVEPLPFVPATWTYLSSLWGLPRKCNKASIPLRPGRIPNFSNEWIYFT